MPEVAMARLTEMWIILTAALSIGKPSNICTV